MEWTIVGVIITLAGFFATVGAPALKLNKSIVELTMTMKQQGEAIKENAADLKEQKDHAHEAHKRLWEHNKEQDDKLVDHEQRIHDLEHK